MTTVVRITATATLRPAIEKREMHEYWDQHRDSFDGPPWLLEDLLDAERDANQLDLEVRLSAHDDAGRRIDADGGFGMSGPRRGLAAIRHRYRGPLLSDNPSEHERLLNETYRVGLLDIEDGINQMLGRDPDQHRPPILAWGRLKEALADEGIEMDDEQLIALPLVVELDAEVAAVLEAG